ncbi:MAG TPA: glycosyltransferase family 2 protein [Thermoanaerobaculia bacterium]|nr:glycosyltransferase family 2 protein [Thermoanaerobaculia bacterium]
MSATSTQPHGGARPALSVVIPVWNEREVLPVLRERLVAALESTAGAWEIVFVDDGSRDGSLDLLVGFHREDPRIAVIELSRNWGHQAALTAGLCHARGDAVVLMDADLQDPPEVIPDLVAAWEQGAKVVLAQRRTRAEGGWRAPLFKLFYRLLGVVSDYPIPLDAGIFGLLDRQPADAIARLAESNRYLPGLRAWVGYRTTVVLYDRAERAAGEPKQSLWKLIRYALDAIFSFSYKPLRLSLVTGGTVAAFAVLYGAALLFCRLLGIGMFGIPVIDGYTSTIVSVLFLGGVQLMGLGILGEYLGRVYDEVKRRPLFLVQRFHRAP